MKSAKCASTICGSTTKLARDKEQNTPKPPYKDGCIELARIKKAFEAKSPTPRHIESDVMRGVGPCGFASFYIHTHTIPYKNDMMSVRIQTLGGQITKRRMNFSGS